MAKKIGRNNLCWCGSGRKYKLCHKDRASEEQLPTGAIENAIAKSAAHQICLHPAASSSTCGKIIAAHTLQRSRVIKAISDGSSHVLTFHPFHMYKNGRLKLNKRGWKQAATFDAFCDKHDGEIFSALEKQDFIGTKEQNFLIGYRATCWELFQKIRATKAQPTLQSLLDRGAPVRAQIQIQQELTIQSAGFSKGRDDGFLQKSLMDIAYLKKDFKDYKCCEFQFEGPLKMASTGTIAPNRTLSGKSLQNLHDLNKMSEWLSFGTDINSDIVSVVFLWRAEHQAPENYVGDIKNLSHDEIPKFLTQFLFAHCENTYFSSEWWNSLDQDRRDHLEKLMANANPYYFPPRYDLTNSFQEWKYIRRVDHS